MIQSVAFAPPLMLPQAMIRPSAEVAISFAAAADVDAVAVTVGSRQLLDT